MRQNWLPVALSLNIPEKGLTTHTLHSLPGPRGELLSAGGRNHPRRKRVSAHRQS